MKMDYREKGTDHMMETPRILANTKRSENVGGANFVRYPRTCVTNKRTFRLESTSKITKATMCNRYDRFT